MVCDMGRKKHFTYANESVVVSFSSLPVFLPTILQSMGFTAINAQGLSAPPYLLSFFVCIGTTWIADRTRQRGLMIIFLSLVGGVGYILLAVSKNVAVRYLGVFLAAGGVFPAISNILPWTLNNQGSDSKRGAGITLLNIIGQCGPLLGTRMFPARDAPYYVTGMSVCASFSKLPGNTVPFSPGELCARVHVQIFFPKPKEASRLIHIRHIILVVWLLTPNLKCFLTRSSPFACGLT